MGKFINPELFDVKFVDGKTWVIRNPMNDWGFTCKQGYISPTDGFETDFASIPPFAWRLVGPPTGFGGGANYGEAAVIHDWLYVKQIIQGKPITRREADLIFLEAMKYLNVDTWRRDLMYLAVRLGGKSYWEK
jgi:hypothetical protein